MWKDELKTELVEALKNSLIKIQGQIIDEDTWMLIDEDIREVIK